MEFRALHHYPEYFKECADVLNEEWKRSLTARLHSLEKSRDSFPVCLVLLETFTENKKHVIGHSRLSDVKGQPMESCLVESVVVKKSHRGKGYGRIIMEETEKFAQSKGYRVMYLTTHDKQEFYKHLGFEFCSPIVTMAMDIVPDHIAQQLLGNLKITNNENHKRKIEERLPPNGVIENQCSSELNPRTSNHIQSSVTDSPSVPPPPVAPPPPTLAPPPPPLLKSSNTGSVDGEKVVRWDPSKVSWMKKNL